MAVGAGLRKFVPVGGVDGGEGGEGVDGGVEAATVMTVCLSSDRRVVDEPTAARFLDTFRGYVICLNRFIFIYFSEIVSNIV